MPVPLMLQSQPEYGIETPPLTSNALDLSMGAHSFPPQMTNWAEPYPIYAHSPSSSAQVSPDIYAAAWQGHLTTPTQSNMRSNSAPPVPSQDLHQAPPQQIVVPSSPWPASDYPYLQQAALPQAVYPQAYGVVGTSRFSLHPHRSSM